MNKATQIKQDLDQTLSRLEGVTTLLTLMQSASEDTISIVSLADLGRVGRLLQDDITSLAGGIEALYELTEQGGGDE